jgi:hypothetical protein
MNLHTLSLTVFLVVAGCSGDHIRVDAGTHDLGPVGCVDDTPVCFAGGEVVCALDRIGGPDAGGWDYSWAVSSISPRCTDGGFAPCTCGPGRLGVDSGPCPLRPICRTDTENPPDAGR